LKRDLPENAITFLYSLTNGISPIFSNLDISLFFRGNTTASTSSSAPHIQPARIETLKKNSTISAKAAIETIKRQYGKYINLFKQVFEPEELINLISHTDQFAYPKRLDHVLMTAMRM
jgi:DNA relaxase NicK